MLTGYPELSERGPRARCEVVDVRQIFQVHSVRTCADTSHPRSIVLRGSLVRASVSALDALALARLRPIPARSTPGRFRATRCSADARGGCRREVMRDRATPFLPRGVRTRRSGQVLLASSPVAPEQMSSTRQRDGARSLPERWPPARVAEARDEPLPLSSPRTPSLRLTYTATAHGRFPTSEPTPPKLPLPGARRLAS